MQGVELGWLNGYPDGNFRPEDIVSPNQVATIIAREYPKGITEGRILPTLIRSTNRFDVYTPRLPY